MISATALVWVFAVVIVSSVLAAIAFCKMSFGADVLERPLGMTEMIVGVVISSGVSLILTTLTYLVVFEIDTPASLRRRALCAILTSAAVLTWKYRQRRKQAEAIWDEICESMSEEEIQAMLEKRKDRVLLGVISH